MVYSYLQGGFDLLHEPHAAAICTALRHLRRAVRGAQNHLFLNELLHVDVRVLLGVKGRERANVSEKRFELRQQHIVLGLLDGGGEGGAWA